VGTAVGVGVSMNTQLEPQHGTDPKFVALLPTV
jgi:hypothetical protein